MTRLSDRRVVRELPVIAVLALVAIGLLLIAGDRWRKGSAVLAASALLAAVLRLVVRNEWVGILAVRSRAFDVVFLLAGAAFLGVLSAGI